MPEKHCDFSEPERSREAEFRGDAVNPDDLPHGCHYDKLRTRVLVPAPHVTLMGTSQPIEIPGE